MSASEPISRRRFAAITGGTFAAFALGVACHGSESQEASDGRVAARPRADVKTSGSGSRALGLSKPRDAILQLPDPLPAHSLPLCVLLHGAGGAGAGIVRRLGQAVAGAGIAVLAPDSREGTWDAIQGRLGRDVAFLDRALHRVFETVSVDAARVSIGGFSDGATYALTLGLINGDLFRRIVAFSPGFVISGPPSGRPRIFVSHGRGDTILPIDQCSRRIVANLQKRGYDVTYREFDGGHGIPEDIASEGMRWAAS